MENSVLTKNDQSLSGVSFPDKPSLLSEEEQVSVDSIHSCSSLPEEMNPSSMI